MLLSWILLMSETKPLHQLFWLLQLFKGFCLFAAFFLIIIFAYGFGFLMWKKSTL